MNSPTGIRLFTLKTIDLQDDDDGVFFYVVTTEEGPEILVGRLANGEAEVAVPAESRSYRGSEAERVFETTKRLYKEALLLGSESRSS